MANANRFVTWSRIRIRKKKEKGEGRKMIPLIAAITPILSSIFGMVDKVIPDKNAATKMKHEIQTQMLGLQGQLQNGQIEINKIEAAHRSIFVAGWRPFLGWVSGVALFWHFMGYDLASWIIVISGSDIVAPALGGTENLMEIVLAMLGLAGFRTFEKFKGVAK